METVELLRVCLTTNRLMKMAAQLCGAFTRVIKKTARA